MTTAVNTACTVPKGIRTRCGRRIDSTTISAPESHRPGRSKFRKEMIDAMPTPLDRMFSFLAGEKPDQALRLIETISADVD